MLALKIRINDEAPIIAGAEDLGVLNATVSCVGKLGSSSRPMPEDEPADLFITVGGLTSRVSDIPDENLNWVSHMPLKPGDVISVEVLDAPGADAPLSRKEVESSKRDEREYFEHCKKVYLRLREKYETR